MASPSSSSRPNSERPLSISSPSLTFTTKILGPLLKSKFLSPVDTIALASTNRAMLISLNVQDAQNLVMPLVVSSTETVKRIEEYFTYQKFEISSPKTTRKSLLGRRFSEKAKPTERALSTSPKSKDGTHASEPRKRMTSWRFTTVVLKNEGTAQAFLAMMAREASPATQSLKSTVQSLELREMNLSFASLSPFSKSLRSLILINVKGWPSEVPKNLQGLLPILRELTVRSTTEAEVPPNVLGTLFPKLESVELSCAKDHHPDVLTGLSDLKRITVSGGARGDMLTSSTKLREVALLDQAEGVHEGLSKVLRSHFLEQKGLRTVDLRRSQFVRLIDVPSETKMVQNLDLSFSQSLTDVTGLANFTGLVVLNLSSCASLREFPSLQASAGLSKVFMSRCANLTSIKGLVECPNLEELDVSYGESLEDAAVEALATCPKLKRLNVSHCGLITTLENVCPPTLQSLLAVKCTNLQTLPAKGASLAHLDCTGCVWIKSLSPTEALQTLKTFSIHGCGRVQSLKPLMKLSALRELDCSFSSIDGFGDLIRGCSSLESIISDAQELAEKVDIAQDPADEPRPVCAPLKNIKFGGWKNLKDVSGLETFASSLVELEITGSKISSCNALRSMTQLRTLRLKWSKRLTDVSALAGLPNLSEIDLEECPVLASVESLGKCEALMWLKLNRCDKLEVLGQLDNCSKLKRVEVQGTERSLSSNAESLRTLFVLEFSQRIAVLYSRAELQRWAEKEFEALQKEFQDRYASRSGQPLNLAIGSPSNKAGGGGCVIC